MLNLRQTALLILRLSPRRTNKSFDASRRGSEARMGEPAMEKLPPAEYDAILRSEFWFFAQRCFAELNPQTAFATNWHLEQCRKPPPVKTVSARGSMEWAGEQENAL